MITKQQIPIYNFSAINFKDLEEIVALKRNECFKQHFF